MPAPNAAAARPAQFDRSSQFRRAMLGKVHIAKKQLGIDDDDYRQIVLDNTGKMSLGDCSDRQIATVLDVLKRKGFVALPSKKAASHPMARKARALWISLYHLGAVHNRSDEALEAFAKRQLKCDRLAWANQREAFKLIEALKNMAVRAGWLQHCRATGKALSPMTLQTSLCSAILIKLKAAGVAPDDWALHDAAWKLCGIPNAKPGGWTAEDYERLAVAMGRALRDAGGTQPMNGEAFNG